MTANNYSTLGHVNMAEESGQCKVQGVEMLWEYGSIQNVRDGCQSSQHAKHSR